MGNNVVTGRAIVATGLPEAVGFHETLGQMMYQYGIQPWDSRSLLLLREKQQELQKTSPLRIIHAQEGLQYYGSQLGGIKQMLSREKFMNMSHDIFESNGLHLILEERQLCYDIFDSIDLHANAKLSLGELAGLSSFLGGSHEEKSDAVFDLWAGGEDRIAMASLQDLLKPYVWCMVPPHAEVLKPLLLRRVAQELYYDMSVHENGYISRREFQLWVQKGLLSLGHVSPTHTNISFAIKDQAALVINRALGVAWLEYEEPLKLREYGKQTWRQNYADRPQHLQDVGVRHYVPQDTPAVTTSTASAFQKQQQKGSSQFNQRLSLQAAAYSNQAPQSVSMQAAR